MNWLDGQVESALLIATQFYINGTLDRYSFAHVQCVEASLSNAVRSNSAAMRLGAPSCGNRPLRDATSLGAFTNSASINTAILPADMQKTFGKFLKFGRMAHETGMELNGTSYGKYLADHLIRKLCAIHYALQF